MKLFALLLMVAIIILSGCQKQEYARDVWSEKCPEGSYANLESGEDFFCENAKSCTNDEDCKYLEISKLPPRWGLCESGKCQAYCGSGRSWKC